jgi:hypothetical protein
MLFTGPKLNFKWLTPILVVLAVLIGTVLKFVVPLSASRYVMLLLNLVGTVLLASTFEPQIPLHGDGGWGDSLKWAIRDFPKYGSPPTFDFLGFYVGLLLLLLGIIVSAVIS